MSRLTRDGTAEPVSRDQILRRERGQGNIIFPSADHEQDWQPHPVDSSLAICDLDPDIRDQVSGTLRVSNVCTIQCRHHI